MCFTDNMKIVFMKRSALPILLGLFLFALSISPVFAQNAVPGAGVVSSQLEQLREKRHEFREFKKDARERVGIGKAASGAAGLRQKAVEAIKTAFENILSRFDAALLRLDKIANRIAARIDKLNSKGVDTSAAKAALLNAEKSGAAAKQAIDKAKSDVSAIDTTSTVKDAVHSAVASVKAAKGSLMSYQKALVLAVRNLKAASGLREGSESGK